VKRPRGKEEVLHVLNLRTGEDRSLAEGIQPATTGAPTWFPDGQSLLVLGKQKAGVAEVVRPAVYRVDLATGEAVSLFDVFPKNGPDWIAKMGLLSTPDGEAVILAYEGRLFRHDLQSGLETDLFRHPNLAAEVLAISPDGTELAFGITDPSAIYPQIRLDHPGRIMVMPTGGGEAREVFELPEASTVRDVAWSSDGRHLLFRYEDEDGTAIMRVPREGGEARRLWGAPQNMGAWAPSPDGRQVAFWIGENEAEIWVMENLVEALKKTEGHQPRPGGR
jgi:Tol biopolymer transport system component